MNHKVISQPVETIKKYVSSEEVARYYLKVELSKLFKEIDPESIDKSINNLKTKNVWGLLEAISFTYHLNGVFFKLSNKGYTWKEEIWRIEDILLTGMDSNINNIIFSKEINGNTKKYKDFLLNYFNENKTNDPYNIFSYKPTNKKVVYKNLIATEKDGKIAMLDGSHRLTEMLLSGEKFVHTYVGYYNKDLLNKDKVESIGGSTIILLTIMYKNGDEEVKKAISVLLKEIISKRINGEELVKKYWIDKTRDSEIKKVGEEIINLIKNSGF